MISLLSTDFPGYALLDSGNRRKLESFGGIRIIRSEPKAWWSPTLPREEWAKAVATHEDDSREGRWKFRGNAVPEPWTLRFRDAFALQLRFMDRSKQIGVFPEQSPHWDWILKNPVDGKKPMRLLNLFGYTGAASLAAARAGWHVTHVDASKPAVAWGRRNQELSGLAKAPIRWILEDAVKFCRREARRGNTYEAILLDPPAFGRGPDGELWKVERDLPDLLRVCRDLLSPEARALILTLYTIDASSVLCGNLLTETTSHLPGGKIEIGELATRETSSAARLLPLSLWGRWSRLK
ncbi:MAG: class I SAM-dependent methyltransferase [Opitutales bacterium]|nr:class I SAM-dependent methyltransferase [Opitutales bacterium]